MSIHSTAILHKQPDAGYTARAVVSGPRTTTIGARVAIGAYAVIYAGATIGSDVLIGDGTKVREGVVLSNGVRLHWNVTINYDASIGEGTTIGTGCHITGGMQIGACCFFGPGVMTANDPDPRLPYDPARIKPPIVGDGVLVGAGAVLLPGVRIGDGVTIGAGAIVDQDVPAGATVAGVRGRRIPVTEVF